MSNTPAKETAAAAPAEPTSFELTLEEFCTRQSSAGVGPEMLAGFFATARAANQLKATEAEFSASLDAFAKAPA